MSAQKDAEALRGLAEKLDEAYALVEQRDHLRKVVAEEEGRLQRVRGELGGHTTQLQAVRADLATTGEKHRAAKAAMHMDLQQRETEAQARKAAIEQDVQKALVAAHNDVDALRSRHAAEVKGLEAQIARLTEKRATLAAELQDFRARINLLLS